MIGPHSAGRSGLGVAGHAAVGLAWAILIGLHSPAPSLAASPAPTPEAGGDTRSAGEGPGLVGAPFLAIGGVLALGVATAAGTLVYVRVTRGPVTVADAPQGHAPEPSSWPVGIGSAAIAGTAGEPPQREPATYEGPVRGQPLRGQPLGRQLPREQPPLKEPNDDSSEDVPPAGRP